MNYANIVNNIAVDVSDDPATHYHPDIAAQFVEVPDEVQTGWVLGGDGSWSAPVAVDPQPEPEVKAAVVSTVHFKLLFTAVERITLRKLREADPGVDDFFDIIDDPRLVEVNLGLASTQNGIKYAVAALVKAGAINSADAETRIAEIISGKMQ